MAQELFIGKDDFIGIIDVPATFDFKRINPYILDVQNMYLTDLLETEYINSIIDSISKERKSIIAVSVGLQTVITLSSADSDLQANGYFEVSDIVGTVSGLLTKRIKILSVSGNQVAIDLNSTGLTYISGGKLKRYLNEENEFIRVSCVEFIVCKSYALALPNLGKYMTRYGYNKKNTPESTEAAKDEAGIDANEFERKAFFWIQSAYEKIRNAYPNINLLKPGRNQNIGIRTVRKIFKYNRDGNNSSIW